MAQRFSFRLDRLLGLRLAEEQQCARLLANARSAMDMAQGALDESGRKLTIAVSQAAEATASVQSAGMLQAILFGLELARGQVQRDQVTLMTATAEMEIELTRFDEARAARRALEKLREQRLQSWKTEQDHAEQRDMDEAGRYVTAKNGELT